MKNRNENKTYIEVRILKCKTHRKGARESGSYKKTTEKAQVSTEKQQLKFPTTKLFLKFG